MFLQQAMNPWFVIQRTSQVLMILLAVAMLFIPILYQSEEAEAVPWVWAGVTLGVAIIGGIAYVIGNHPPHCDRCGDHAKTTDHEYMCTYRGCGHQWNCSSGSAHYHCECYAIVSSADAHQEECHYCGIDYKGCIESTRHYHESGNCFW